MQRIEALALAERKNSAVQIHIHFVDNACEKFVTLSWRNQ